MTEKTADARPSPEAKDNKVCGSGCGGGVLDGFWKRLGDYGLIVASEEHHGGSEKHAAEGSHLGVRHGVVEVDAGVDADELYEKAADAAEQEVFAGKEAEGERFGGALPEPPREG